MTEQICRIKNHIIELNSINYDDDTRLDSFLLAVKETIVAAFTPYCQYMTFLESICFRPVTVLSSHEESVRFWSAGKKQLRELLLVMLIDPRLQNGHELVIADARQTCHELEQASRIVEDHISLARDVSSLPRIRIDLRDINILDKKVEHYLTHDVVLPPGITGRVLFIAGTDTDLNEKVALVFKGAQMEIVQVPYPFKAGSSIIQQLLDDASIQAAVVALGEDCWVSLNGNVKSSPVSSPAPAVCFALGVLVGRLGRGNVFGLYKESPLFRRPTDFFDLFYIQVEKSGHWQREFLSRMNQRLNRKK